MKNHFLKFFLKMPKGKRNKLNCFRYLDRSDSVYNDSGIKKPVPVKNSKIPRRHQFSGVTVHNVEFEKGPGIKKGQRC